MMHKAWKEIVAMSYCFWRSSVKFRGHRRQKIGNIEPISASPDCKSNLNSLMTTKWCIKLEETKERCLIVLQCHLSYFVVMGDKKMTILTGFERYRTGSPSWMHWWLWNDTQSWKGMEEGPCCFSRPLVQFQGHIGQTDSLGRSQLSNPSDLPCCNGKTNYQKINSMLINH